ncbi:hypothetical protein, partial [Bradyrhizobium cosmicum]|uniref:hypothetical protein n=1 Tax=Bradyrhizobium cosmicum TaxID=1404864 RepID=UPI0028EAB281
VAVGSAVGVAVGSAVGVAVGLGLGVAVGSAVGVAVGFGDSAVEVEPSSSSVFSSAVLRDDPVLVWALTVTPPVTVRV